MNYEARKGDPTTTRKFWTYDHRVNPLQAIHAVTIGPAYQNKVEDRIGSIAEGKLADFVILDEDIMDVAAKEPLRIADMRVASTIVADKVVHGVLPDSKTFISQFCAAYEQPTLTPSVTVQSSQMIDKRHGRTRNMQLSNVVKSVSARSSSPLKSPPIRVPYSR